MIFCLKVESSISLQILDRVKFRLESDFPSHSFSSDGYIQMRQAQESFMTSHSAKVRGRDDIVMEVRTA